MPTVDPRYVAARRVLLNALEALAPHGPAVIVAGAQAVYLRSGAIEITIPVDLIVPEGASPLGGRRGARLGRHGNRAARRAVGLEAALVDHSTMTVAALEPGDDRSLDVEVAGEAALLVRRQGTQDPRQTRLRTTGPPRG